MNYNLSFELSTTQDQDDFLLVLQATNMSRLTLMVNCRRKSELIMDLFVKKLVDVYHLHEKLNLALPAAQRVVDAPAGFSCVRSTDGQAVPPKPNQPGGSEMWIKEDLMKEDSVTMTYSDRNCRYVLRSGVLVEPQDPADAGTASCQEANFYPSSAECLYEQLIEFLTASRKLLFASTDEHGCKYYMNDYKKKQPSQRQGHYEEHNLDPRTRAAQNDALLSINSFLICSGSINRNCLNDFAVIIFI